jgi:hypothetical protein
MATCGVHKTGNAALFKLTHHLEDSGRHPT